MFLRRFQRKKVNGISYLGDKCRRDSGVPQQRQASPWKPIAGFGDSTSELRIIKYSLTDQEPWIPTKKIVNISYGNKRFS
jgi:hypothetical protein